MTQTFEQYTARLGDFIRRAARFPNEVIPSATEVEFNELALALFALQFEHNQPYRNLCAARQVTPASVRHWSQIPAAPASAFKELDLTSLPQSERTTVFHSSGTTAQKPSRHFHSRESLAVYEASLRPWFQRHLLPELDDVNTASRSSFQFISLAPAASAACHSSLAHMFDTVCLAFGSGDSFSAGRLNEAGDWELDLHSLIEKLCAATRPVVLLGTAFTFVHLLDELAVSPALHLPAGSRALETGGYKGRSRSLPKAELHSLMAGRLGLAPDHIVSEYGMSELSSQAYDLAIPPSRTTHHAPRLFRFPPWARTQIISPETSREITDGAPGLLRIFDLANVRSVLAVQTEDLAIRRDDGFELLGRAALDEPRGCSLLTV